MKFSKLSQTDKRIQFAKKSAEMLLQFKCEPFELLKKFNGDLLEIKNQLIKNQGMGFGNKKADMFKYLLFTLNYSIYLYISRNLYMLLTLHID